MEAIRIYTSAGKDGEINLRGLPCKEGDEIEVIVLLGEATKKKKGMTGAELANSEIVGMWKDREDTKDSSEYARKLREHPTL